jgi:hypothetical protein
LLNRISVILYWRRPQVAQLSFRQAVCGHLPDQSTLIMTETHCETALRHIQRVVTIASAENAPITLAEALEQIVETLDLAGFGPVGPGEGEGRAGGAEAQLH